MSVQKITVEPGSTITVNISEGEHPRAGILASIEGNPRGFIPFSLLGKNDAQRRARYDELVANPCSITVVVEEARMYTPEATEGNPNPRPRPRIILNAQRAYSERVHAEREKAAAHLRKLVEALATTIAASDTPVTMQAVVTGIAQKKNKDGSGQHTYGVWVELDNSVPALLHKSQMTQDHSTGDKITVVVKSAEMNDSRARVGVSEVPSLGVSRQTALSAGIKTTGTDIRRGKVKGIEGFTMMVKGVKAFLPLSAVPSNPESLLKGNRSARVWVTPILVDGYVQVTRRPDVGELIAEVEGVTDGDFNPSVG